MDFFDCVGHSSNFTTACIPGANGDGFDLRPVVDNIRSGMCREVMLNVASSCAASSFSYLLSFDPRCYENRTTLETCLPGYNAKHTKDPPTCWWLSNLVFFTNEASTFLSGPKKAIAIAMTYIFRKHETDICLHKCEGHNFEYLGPKEYRLETSRYARGITSRAIAPVMGAVQGGVSGGPFGALGGIVCGFYADGKANTVNQVIAAPIQQRARNLDFKEAHEVCVLSSDEGLLWGAVQGVGKGVEGIGRGLSYVAQGVWQTFWGAIGTLLQPGIDLGSSLVSFVGSVGWAGVSLISNVVHGIFYVISETFSLLYRAVASCYLWLTKGEDLDFSGIVGTQAPRLGSTSLSHNKVTEMQKRQALFATGLSSNDPKVRGVNQQQMEEAFEGVEQEVEETYMYVDIGAGASIS